MRIEALNATLVKYYEATQGNNYEILTNVDASVEVHIGCIRIVFVNKFVGDVMVSSSFTCTFGGLLYKCSKSKLKRIVCFSHFYTI